MTKNKLSDLNNHLFSQLERLNDESLSKEELNSEIARSNAIAKISQQVINNGNLVLKAKITYEDHIGADAEKPEMLEG